jgi:anti-sigma factor RsiW
MDQAGWDIAGIEDLGAFVDGELDPISGASVAAAIYANAEASQAAYDIRDQNAGLRELFEDVLDEPIPASMQMLINSYRVEWRQAS